MIMPNFVTIANGIIHSLEKLSAEFDFATDNSNDKLTKGERQMIDWCNANQGFTSAVLALFALLVSLGALIISKRTQEKILRLSMQQQKDIHNRDVKLTLQQKVLEIYNAFCDCQRLLQFDDTVLGMKIGLLLKPRETITQILDHRTIVIRAFDEANLFFKGDKPLQNYLLELLKDYLSLSAWYCDLLPKDESLFVEAICKINTEFPELKLRSLHEINKILAYPQARMRLEAMLLTPELERFDNAIKIYGDKFSYEKFDKLFEKYLIRDEL